MISIFEFIQNNSDFRSDLFMNVFLYRSIGIICQLFKCNYTLKIFKFTGKNILYYFVSSFRQMFGWVWFTTASYEWYMGCHHLMINTDYHWKLEVCSRLTHATQLSFKHFSVFIVYMETTFIPMCKRLQHAHYIQACQKFY